MCKVETFLCFENHCAINPEFYFPKYTQTPRDKRSSPVKKVNIFLEILQ